MRLIYPATNKEVKIGDEIHLRNDALGLKARVEYFREPHKPASSGKVNVTVFGTEREFTAEYYVGVIGAEWIEREDRI
jgi:hypothetical protein